MCVGYIQHPAAVAVENSATNAWRGAGKRDRKR